MRIHRRNILCKSKDRTVVEYTLKEAKWPIGVSTYRVLDKVPEDLRSLLPAPEQIAMLLNKVDENQ
ncbi:MAG: PDDEXK nuclease domain-containing protein [bacterium]|nr:PDDEXK nuclease domain-containing protein [bacterium]